MADASENAVVTPQGNFVDLLIVDSNSGGAATAPARPKAKIDWERSDGKKIVLVWEPLDPVPTEYWVEWKPNIGNSPRTTTENEMLIELEPGNRYLISVMGVNQGIPGLKSNEESYRSAPRAPKITKVEEDTETSIVVEYEDPDDRPKMYEVTAEDKTTGEILKSRRSANNQSCRVQGLTPEHIYDIFVEAFEENKKEHYKSNKSFFEHLHIQKPPPPKLICEPLVNGGYKLSWGPVKGAKEYKIKLQEGSEELLSENTPFEIFHFTSAQLQPEKQYLISVYPIDKNGTEMKPSLLEFSTPPPAPQNIRITMLSTDEAIIEWNECRGATGYDFTITFESNGGNNDEKHTPTQPKQKISQEGWQKIKVSICSTSKVASSPPSEVVFRNVLLHVKESVEVRAARVLLKKNYVEPIFSTVKSSQQKFKFEDAIYPQSGEVVVVQAGSFCGKTALCSYCLQSDPEHRLPIFVDADDFSSEEDLDVISFFRRCLPSIPPLSDEELNVLLCWMENFSKDVVFVVDNAPFRESSGSSKLLVAIGVKVKVSEIFQNLLNSQRSLFKDSAVLGTTFWSQGLRTSGMTRVLTIDGFDETRVGQMKRNMEITVDIPLDQRYLCVNPGFCNALLENTAQHLSHTSAGILLMDIISKLVEDLYENSNRKHARISYLKKKILYSTNDIGPIPKTNSKKPCSSGDLARSDLQRLEVTYRTSIYCAFFKPLKEFDDYFSHKRTLGINDHSLEWRFIAGLLREEVFFKAETLFMEKIPHHRERAAIMKNFIRSSKENINDLLKKNPQLAAAWYTCIYELNDEDLINKFGNPITRFKPKHGHEIKQIFLKNIPEQFKKRLTST